MKTLSITTQTRVICCSLTTVVCHQTIITSFTFSSSVRDLGVTLDSELTFANHISLLT